MNRRKFLQGISTAVVVFNSKSVLATDLSIFENKKPILRFAVASDFHYAQPKTAYQEMFDTALNHNRGLAYDMHSKHPDIHVSEWAWIGTMFDYVLSNNGSKVELEACVKHMLDIYTGPVMMKKSA